MRLLLDTHILLWALGDDPALGGAHRRALAEAEALFVSAATIWEISIKRALGKLTLRGDPMVFAAAAGCAALPISWAHADAAGRLPAHHGDPFDRLLIAQAQGEGLTLVSADAKMALYDVDLI